MNWRWMLSVTPDDRLELSEAYTRVFRTGGSSDVDRERVLNDIMTFSGYFAVTVNKEDLAINEGKRSVGGLIFSMTFMPDEERDALYQATRQSKLEEQKYG
jgi:hypothetical protein